MSVVAKASWVRGGSPTCRCGQPKHRLRWACATCDAAYRRAYRAIHPDRPRTGVALLRSRARAYANTYLRRGTITRQACFDCGSDQAKMRHADFSKPLEITWLCDECCTWP
jgi:hypothetical protein